MCITIVYNFEITTKFWGYEVEDKLHLGVRDKNVECHWSSTYPSQYTERAISDYGLIIFYRLPFIRNQNGVHSLS